MGLPGAAQQAVRILILVLHPVTPVHRPPMSSWVWCSSCLSGREAIGSQERTLCQMWLEGLEG